MCQSGTQWRKPLEFAIFGGTVDAFVLAFALAKKEKKKGTAVIRDASI